MMSNEALMKSNEAVERARDKTRVIIDNDASQIIFLMAQQSNPQFKLRVKKGLGPGVLK